MTLGPVITEIMSRKFAAVTDEMTTNLKRASRSVYVKEAGDFGVGLTDLESLAIVALGHADPQRIVVRHYHAARRARCAVAYRNR